MKIVELRRRRPEDASIEAIARVYVPDGAGRAVVEPVRPTDRAWIESLVSNGVVGGDGRLVTRDDGERYVDALPYSFRGSRLWAEEVPDEAPPR